MTSQDGRHHFKTGAEVALEHGLDPTRTQTLADFQRAGLPMVVACHGCLMTMVLYSAHVDAAGRCWCADCADVPRN